MRNFAMHFWRTIAGHGDAVALVSPDENNATKEVTFNEWVRRVHRLAVGLMEKGIRLPLTLLSSSYESSLRDAMSQAGVV